MSDPQDQWKVMLAAHNLCPVELSFTDRMRWMTKYFLDNVSNSHWVEGVGHSSPQSIAASAIVTNPSTQDPQEKT